MEVIGRGRITVWEGAALWLLESAQPRAELSAHSHHAIQITFSLAGSVAFDVEGTRLEGPIVAVAADAPHTFMAHGVAAFLFVEPESAAGRTMTAQWFHSQQAVEIDDPRLSAACDAFADCHANGHAGEDELIAIARSLLESMPPASSHTMPDPRAQAMIAFARANLEGPITLPAAASHACLSSDRARHLFVEQTGLPFKTYVLWLRLQRAVALYAAGHSLTEAAHAAGFSDSAHLSRTFRRTFGLPATALRLG